MSASEDDWDEFAPPAKATKKSATKAATRAPAKVTKPKTVAKPKSKPVLGDANVSMEDDAIDSSKAPSKGKSANSSEPKSVEEIYQKKTQLEHILIRPDTYIGSIESQTVPMWVYEDDKMVYRDTTYVPGLYKIFDEIIVNAADNKVRDPTMDTIKVNIDKENSTISVYNNGRGIPIEMHSKEKVYVPELIFGHLLTSSNYDDDEKKVTGGRNGYGAKLCNIFSKEFIVETADSVTGRKFVQTHSDNMTKKSAPRVTANPKGENYTKISFKPDLEKFGMSSIDSDFEALAKKRIYDLAGCVRGVKVFLNDVRLKLKDFKDYVELYVNSATHGGIVENPVIIYERPNERWEVAFTLSDGHFQQVSFVNSICTTKGGTHVEHVAAQLASGLMEAVKKKDKKAIALKPQQVKNHMWVFVNCSIENPAFDSQTKENMTLKQSSFGSKCGLTEDFMKKVVKSGVVDNILSFARFKQDQLLKKTDGGKKSRFRHAKLDEANNAGVKNGHQCTLILTEGDSAKTLAVSGLSVIGRDNFGVFPLRGKLLNVREASHSQIAANAEITAIKKIIGLEHGKVYETVKGLRYGSLMIMTDQDHDGSHIKGLIINLIDHFWPSLLKVPGFLLEFITPIIKVTKGEGKKRQERAFFTIPEYETWKAEHADAKGWTIKYYKGLGTSESADAKKYFSDLDTHLKRFSPARDGDRELIDMAFSKKKADDRKEWLRQFQPGTYMDHNRERIPLDEFINKELILFSMADNARSIPSAIDGLKPGQRKIIWSSFKKNLKSQIKVAQLVGYVSEQSAYHHGEASLASTIVGLAQTFVGSNNLSLLQPHGQFGTRLQGGKDAASPRYIFTALSPLARALFQPSDDALLTYVNDDGVDVEPEWYLPILPMLLINGAEGIGTGWSTSIPNYNPREIVENIFRMMAGQDPLPMQPWYRGFKGSIEQMSKDKYKVTGVIKKINDTTVEISELPIRCWTQSYKEDLESWLVGTEKETAWITDYKEYHTDTSVRFTVTLSEEQMALAEKEGLEKRFKLVGSISTSNLVCFDQEGRIKKYENIEGIFTDFYDLRRRYYQKRKDHLLDELNHELTKINNKVRFVTEIIEGELVVQKKRKAVLLQELKQRKYTPFYNKKAPIPEEEDENEDSATDNAQAGGYDYLLTMPIWNLTMEKVEQLKNQRDQKESEIVLMTGLSIDDLWRTDLDGFLAQWDDFEKKMEAADAQVPKNGTTAAGGGRKPAGAKKTTAVAKGKTVATKAKAPEPVSDENNDDDFMVADDSSTINDPAELRNVKQEKPKRVVKTAPKSAKPAAASKAATSAAIEDLTENMSTISIDKKPAVTAAKKRTLGGRKTAAPGQARAPVAMKTESKSETGSSTTSSPGSKNTLPASAAATSEWNYDSGDNGMDDYMDIDALASTAAAAFGKPEAKPVKPVTSRAQKPAAAPAPAKSRAARVKGSIVESDSDETTMGDLPRSSSPAKKKATAARGKKDAAKFLSDSDAPSPIAKAAPRRKAQAISESEYDLDLPASLPLSKKPTAPAAASRKKPVAVASETDDEGDDITPAPVTSKVASSKSAVAVKIPAAGRTTRGKQPVKYVDTASEEDEDVISDFEGSEIEESESDFEGDY